MVEKILKLFYLKKEVMEDHKYLSESFFENPGINLGWLNSKNTYRIEFLLKEEAPKIFKVLPGCGCTTFDYKEGDKVIKVKYVADTIPPQVKGDMHVSKTITVYFEGNLREVISFSGVIRKLNK